MLPRERLPRPGEIEYSEAAMDEWRASRRRYIRPGLVFAPVMVVSYNVHAHEALALSILLGGGVVTWVMIGRNRKVALIADRRLKAEKREWEAKHREPS